LSKLIPVSRQELIRRLKRLGFGGPYLGSGHAYMVKEVDSGRIYVTIPNPHHSKDIGIKLLAQILKEGEISREKWFSVQ
jgi:predicted RNA binding protein YcfA (HicA-like mRNA interferase family)